MNIVLDTNVLIAALITSGKCADLLEHCILNHTVFTSEFILNELHQQLTSKFKYNTQDADDSVALLKTQLQMINPITLEQSVCRDVDDDQIIGTALACHANCIVTGDKDLLILQQYQNIHIINPNGFILFEASMEGQ